MQPFGIVNLLDEPGQVFGHVSEGLDLPLNFHPVAIRASVVLARPSGAAEATVGNG